MQDLQFQAGLALMPWAHPPVWGLTRSWGVGFGSSRPLEGRRGVSAGVFCSFPVALTSRVIMRVVGMGDAVVRCLSSTH